MASKTQHRDIAALSDRQHGPVSLEQLKGLGVRPSTARARVAAGRLFRLYPMVYSLVPPGLLTAKGRYMAAVLACGPDAVLSHRSAAHLLELRPTTRVNIDVTVPGRRRHHHAGVDLHRSTTLTAADITPVDGIPTTTVARTLLDLADVVLRRQLERALDQAAILHVLDAGALGEQCGRNRRRPAAATLAQILAEHEAGSTPTQSEFEEQMFAACRQAGVPAPRVNLMVAPDQSGSPLRIDFAWPEHKLAVETDGAQFHLTRGAFETDRERDQRLVRAGWRVVRITWRQLTNERARIAELLRTLLS